jgi:hypothetical protein
VKPARLALPAALSILAALSLCGCVDLKADVSLAANGSGRLSVDYRVDRAVVSLERSSVAANTLPLPLDKTTMDRRIQAVPGMVLSGWSREDLPDEVHISADFRFPDLASLAKFLDPSGKRVVYRTVDRVRELKIVLTEGNPPTDDSVAWAQASYGRDSVNITIALPARAAFISAGTLSTSGTVARYSVPTADIIKSPDLLFWTIRW